MYRRSCGGLSFAPPPDWEDRSILVLSAPERIGEAASTIVVLREARREGDMRMHLWRRFVEARDGGTAPTLLETDDLTVAGRPAVRMRLSRESPDGEIDQTIVCIDAPDDDLLTLTCSTSASARPTATGAFTRVLASVHFDPSASMVVPRSSAPEVSEAPLPFIPMPGDRAKRR